MRRGDAEVCVSVLDVRPDDVVCHSGMWLQLCTTRLTFGEVEGETPFAHQRTWFIAVKDGNRPMVRRLAPNVPFGEPSGIMTPLPFLGTASVDVLDFKLAP